MRADASIGHDGALAAIEAIRSELAKRGKPAAIAVVDAHGELVAALREDGSALSWVTLAINKAYTAARLRRPTRLLGEQLRSRGTDIVFYGDPRYVGFGGGVPIEANGAIVGGVAVSGLSDEDDEALAALGAAAALARG